MVNVNLRSTDTWAEGIEVPFEYKRVAEHGMDIQERVNILTRDGWSFIGGYSRDNTYEVVWMVRQK